MAEVRPDPDIGEVDRNAAETARLGELFVLWVSRLRRRLLEASGAWKLELLNRFNQDSLSKSTPSAI